MKNNVIFKPGEKFCAPLPARNDIAPACCAGILSHVLGGLRQEPALRRGRSALARHRHFAIYLCHVAFGLSQRLLAKLFGRDRSTIRYICARIEDLRDNPRIDRMLDALEAASLAFAAAFAIGGARA